MALTSERIEEIVMNRKVDLEDESPDKNSFIIRIIDSCLPRGEDQQEFIVDLIQFVADRLGLNNKDFYVVAPVVTETFTQKVVVDGE